MDAVMRFAPSQSPFADLGPAHAVAYDPRAPKDEVQDASAALAKLYLQDLGVLVPDMDSQTLRDWDRLTQAEKMGNRLLSKALKTVNPGAAKAKAQHESWFATVGGGGLWLQKPGLPFETLRQLSTRIEVAQALHLTLRRQVQKFSEMSTREDQMGFRIRHADEDHEATPDQKDYFRWLGKFLLNGGREFRPHVRRQLGRFTFREFLGQLVEDALTFDNAAVETIPLTGMDGLDSFYPRDGGTFFLSTDSEKGIYAYQSLVGLPEEHFTFEELVLFQRNRSTDINRRGYGRSELEASVDTMSLFLQAMDYTREGIDNNAIPRGLLTVFGQFDRTQQQAFQQAWSAKIRGVKNRFGLPVLFSRNGQAGATFTGTGAEFSEMAFAKWMGLQTAIFCAIYGADPKEINLDGWSSGNTSSLSGDDTAEKLAASKNKFLGSFLADAESFTSDDIIGRFTTDARVQFTGLDPMEAKARREREEKVSTINELRASLQMKAHPIGWFGDLPADSGLLSAEYQRVKEAFTYDETRRTWGGLPAYPAASVGAAPINANLQGAYQQATQPAPDPSQMGNPFDQFNPEGGDDPDGDGEGHGAPENDPGAAPGAPLPEGGPGAQAKAQMMALAGKGQDGQ